MLALLAPVLALSMVCQSPSTDLAAAEQLARSGRNVEALTLFEQIVAANPTDIEARMWIGLLQLRLGRNEESAAAFRSVVLEHPSNVDARIGLGAALTRAGNFSEAIEVLHETEKDAGENADLFAALARAYRRVGDDRRALDYYKRAKALAPGDPDVVEGYEATLRAYGAWIVVDGFAEGGGSDKRSVVLTGAFRVHSRLQVEGLARAQNHTGSSDAQFGGGVLWRVNRSTNLDVRAAGGAGNTSLPVGDFWAEARHYRGSWELGGIIRYLSFSDVSVIAFTPLLAWDPGTRWRLAGRYAYSISSFHTTDESSGDHSVLLRGTVDVLRRVDVTATYAYGIESYENLTADRLGNLGSNTVAGTLRIRTPSLTTVIASWEHQWRSNDTTIDRLTVSVMQGFR